MAQAPPLSGFSIVKNATLRDYPVEASLRSALALCEEVVVNVGASEDDTAARVRALADEEPRLRPFLRRWPEEVGGALQELSAETNRALERCRHDWALYLQADEVIHEEDHPALRERLARAAAEPRAEGLVFDYLHFYGSPEWVLTGRRAYRREVRVVRRSAGVRSVHDAQGFRRNGRVPRVLPAGARVFHYGHVKTPAGMREKKRLSARIYGEEDPEAEEWTYRAYRGLRRFRGTHPAPVRAWLRGRADGFDPRRAPAPERSLRTLKVRISDAVERATGRRLFERRNYELIE